MHQLRRRADVLQIERELVAATAQVGVAETGYYPELKLFGSFQIAATNFSGLGDISKNMTYGITPAISCASWTSSPARSRPASRRRR